MLSLRVALLMSSTVLTAFTCLHAQESNRRVTQPIDFSDAVEKLVALNFADTKGADYIKISTGSNHGQLPLSSLQNPPKLSGNAWFKNDKTSPKTGTIFLGYGQQAPFTVITKNSSQPFQPFQAGQPISSKTQPADLKKDLTALLKWLVDLETNEDDASRRSDADIRHTAPILAFAVMAHRSGHKESANAIIQKLLTSINSPEKIIDSLISKIADQELSSASAKLTQGADWKSYYATLQKIDQTYQRGWDKHPGLQLLLPKAKLRADGDLSAVPKLAGITFSDEAITELQATLSTPVLPATSYLENPLWLLNKKPAQSNSKSPFNQLTTLGMDGFIALISLLDDDTLVIQGTANQRDYYYSSNNYFNSYSDDPEEIAYSAYASMTRPKTRGELAINFIQPYFEKADNDSYNSSSEPDIAALKSQALAWYKAHKEDTPITLAKYFLQNGEEKMMTGTAAHLIFLESDEANQLIEKTILSSAQPSSYAASVKPYIIKRREAGSEFLKKYEALLIKELGDGPDFEKNTSAQYQISRDGGVTKFIAKLNKYTKPVSPKVLLTNLSRKDAKTTEILELLASQLKGKPLGELRPKFIYAAAKSEPAKARMIIGVLLQLDIPNPTSMDEAYAVEIGSFEAQDWKKLLAEKPDEENARGESLRRDTALLLENLFTPTGVTDSYYEIRATLPPATFSTLIDTRTKAILERAELPSLPASDDINNEQMLALVGKIAGTQPTKMNSVIERFTPSEFLALKNHLDANGAPKNYLLAQSFVQRLKLNEQQEKIPNKDEIQKLLESHSLIGCKLTEDYFSKLTELIKANKEIFNQVAINLQNSPNTIGFELSLFKTPLSYLRQLQESETLLKEGEIDYYISLIRYSENSGSQKEVLSSDPESAPKFKAEVKDYIGSLLDNQSSSCVIITATKLSLKKRQEELKKSRAPKEALLKKMAETPGGSVYADHFEDQLDSVTLEQLQSYYDRILSNQ